jgi:hypothetical protein
MEEKTETVRRPNKRKSRYAESFIVKYGLKILLGFVTIVIFLTIIQCTIKKPEAPIWTTSLNIPAVNRTYSMPEIIRKIDQPGLEMDSTGEITYTFSEELDSIKIDGDLTTDPIYDTVCRTIGQITIDPVDPEPDTLTPGDFGLPLWLTEIPEGWLDTINIDVPPREDFNWATISSGVIYVKVTNDFGVDLDTVIVQLMDLNTQTLISSGEFPTAPGNPAIPNGSTDSVALDLGGRTVSNHFGLVILCHTPGGSPWSLDDKQIAASITFGDGIIISAAEAKIPQITKDLSETVELASEHTIISADLASGNLQLVIENRSNLVAELDLTFPDFTLAGDPLAVNRTVQPAGTEFIDIDLSGYTFEPNDQVRPQEIAVNVSAVINDTARMVVVDEDDEISVRTSLSNLNFAALTGIIDSTETNIDNEQVELDLPKGFDSLQLVSAVLTVEIENGVGLSGSLDLDINGDGGQYLHLTGNIIPGSCTDPVISTIIDSNLSSFLNPPPGNITLSGSAFFGDGVSVGTITDNDFVVPRISITSPLEVVINQATFTGDTTSEEIDQDDIDIITDRFIEGRFIGSVTNHLPLGISVEIYMDGDSSRLNASDAHVIIGPIAVNAGAVDGEGVVTETTVSEISVVFDSLDIQVLKNDILYTSQEITIAGSGGQAVKISGADYIILEGVIQAECRFDGEF